MVALFAAVGSGVRESRSEAHQKGFDATWLVREGRWQVKKISRLSLPTEAWEMELAMSRQAIG